MFIEKGISAGALEAGQEIAFDMSGGRSFGPYETLRYVSFSSLSGATDAFADTESQAKSRARDYV